MTRKPFTLFIILIVLITLCNCVSNKKDEIGVIGYVKDNQGNLLGNVSITYNSEIISVQTDSLGNYIINTPRAIFIEFKKEGYQTLTTKIDDFSEEGSYNLKTVVLKKTNTSKIESKDIYKNVKPQQHRLKFSGNVTTILNTPIKNVKITLIDNEQHSTTSKNIESNKGYFSFRKYQNTISFEKEGFRNLQINQYTYKNNSPKIKLLEKSNRKEVYHIKSGEYIPLPKTKLLSKSKRKEDTYLLIFAGSYKITDFYYPNNAKEFEIKKDSIIRFAIYNTNTNKLCKVKDTSNYLCTVKYKYYPSFIKGNFEEQKIIYPSELCINCKDEPLIVELKPDAVVSDYMFVNPSTKNGYYFTY